MGRHRTVLDTLTGTGRVRSLQAEERSPLRSATTTLPGIDAQPVMQTVAIEPLFVCLHASSVTIADKGQETSRAIKRDVAFIARYEDGKSAFFWIEGCALQENEAITAAIACEWQARGRLLAGKIVSIACFDY